MTFLWLVGITQALRMRNIKAMFKPIPVSLVQGDRGAQSLKALILQANACSWFRD